eukprot:65999_1
MAQAATKKKTQVKDRLKSGEYRLLRIKNPPAFIGLAHNVALKANDEADCVQYVPFRKCSKCWMIYAKATSSNVIKKHHTNHHSTNEDIVLIKKYDTYLEAQQRLNRSTSESDFVMDDPDAPEEQTRTNFCDLLGYSDDEEDEEDVQGQDEVDTYLALNISSHDRSLSKDNPLAWWSNADSRFGLVYLKRLTAWLYSIKGSSCPSEGMFSEYGNIVSAKTARLGEKKAEDTLFLHQQRKKKHEKR